MSRIHRKMKIFNTKSNLYFFSENGQASGFVVLTTFRIKIRRVNKFLKGIFRTIIEEFSRRGRQRKRRGGGAGVGTW